MQTVTIISSLIGAMALIAGAQTFWMSRMRDALNGRMDRLDGRMDRLDGRVDALGRRLDHQSDIILREHGERLARLEAQGE